MNTHPTPFSLSLLLISSFFLSGSSAQLSSVSNFKAFPTAQIAFATWVFLCVKICGYLRMNTLTSCEDMRMESVVCPKPRRLGLGLGLFNFNNHSSRPISYQSEREDSSAVGEELLDIILPKESCYPDRSWGQVVASSPPFFCGSPPSRASNPVIQDEQFGNGNFSPFTSSPSSSSARGCVPMKFGHTPAAVRIEGFDCLSRDRSNCSISAVA